MPAFNLVLGLALIGIGLYIWQKDGWDDSFTIPMFLLGGGAVIALPLLQP